MSSSKSILLIAMITAACACSGLNAQPVSVAYTNGMEVRAERHEVVDISFKLRRMPAVDPFDLVFGIKVLDESGHTMDIPGFYNGDTGWLFRFSSGKVGNFRFETYSSHRELSGLKGRIIVDGKAHKNKQGAVIIDPEKPRNFAYEDGSPYFGIIFELDWLFALDVENHRDIPRTRQIIKDIKDNGFNQVVMNVYFDYVVKRYQAFPNIIWDVSKEALDYGRCDIDYINERIDRVRKLDAFKRLLTVHDYEYNSREAHRVDFISIQSWRPNLYNLMLQARATHADKPVVNIEHGGYEEGPYLSFQGNYVNAEQCLVRAYECVFAVEQKLTTNSRLELENLSSGGIPLTNGKDMFLFLIPGTTFQINTVLPKPESGKLSVVWFNIFTGEYTPQRIIDWSGWQPFRSPWENTTSILIIKHHV